jgi:UV DNA damage repair endonuclease
MTIKKIGFACKISEFTSKNEVVSIPEYNSRSTTAAWLNRQSKDIAETKLWELTELNIEAARKAVEYVGNLEESLRCFRLGSDILPVYTEPRWKFFYGLPDVRAYCEREFGKVGDVARERGVRLSMHPGQFCCIVSDSEDIVNRSIEELEYHTDMIRWMSFGQSKLDFKLNIHLSGRKGVAGFDYAWHKMSPELRNCLTLENDEYQKGLDDLLVLKDKVGIVLDIHHHLIKEDEYIQPDDPRIDQVKESWKGVRPTIHYSQSRQEYIGAFSNIIPTMPEMLTVAKKSKLRAHSDFYTNKKINEWALHHLEWADIMAESKGKNLASLELFTQWREHI